jgi:hypothetical protein
LYVCLNVFALGGGPLFTGWVIDRFAQADFHGLDTRPAAQSAGRASFISTCPGGAARARANAEARALCNATLARATRQGILVTLVFFGWAFVHYFLASLGIAKTLKAAAARNAAVAVPP